MVELPFADESFAENVKYGNSVFHFCRTAILHPNFLKFF